jgi:DNA transformation protein and related proteins
VSARDQLDLASDLADRMDGFGTIRVSRYFGGAGLRSGGILFAFVMKGMLYLRVDERARVALEKLGGVPFVYEGAWGPVTVPSYCQAPESVVDNDDELSRWAEQAHRIALSGTKDSARKPRRLKARPIPSRGRAPRRAGPLR